MYQIKQHPEDFIVREIMDLKLERTGKFSYYLLKKRNLTTQEAVERIARVFHLKPKFINYAGLKDRVAVTYQYISISGGRHNNIIQPDFTLEYLGNGRERISLGQLTGNEFEIIVRNVKVMPRRIKRIINLFDQQRFGIRGNNHLVGQAIVKRKFRAACELIDDSRVLEHLEEHPNDYVGALKRIPLKILRLYIHAYQSHIWNRMAQTTDKSELPIIGFDSRIGCEEVSPDEFLIREIPALSCEGTVRSVYAMVKDLAIEKTDDKTLKIGFKLQKGSYGTQVIKEMFKYQK